MTENPAHAPIKNEITDEYCFEITTVLMDMLKEYAKQHNMSIDEASNDVIQEAMEFIDKYQKIGSITKLDIAIKNYVEGFGCLEVIMRDNIKLDQTNDALIGRIETLSSENQKLIKELNEVIADK